jgi:hypothetical protein
MPELSSPNNASADLLKSARDIAFILAIYLYFAGWVYLYTYFSFFGLSVGQQDTEFYTFIIYSVNVLSFLVVDHYLLTFFTIIVSLAILHWLNYRSVVYAICIFLMGLLYYSAILSATDDAKKAFAYRGSTLHRISFVMKKEKVAEELQPVSSEIKTQLLSGNKVIDTAFRYYNEHRQLRLLCSSTDAYFVIFADKSNTYFNSDSKDIVVYAVGKADISLVQLIK